MDMSKFIANISSKALKALAAGAASIFATAVVDKLLLAKNDEVADPIEMKPERPDVGVDDEVQTEETVEEVNED